MTYTTLIRFAPITTLERVNNPRWKQNGRTMYDAGSLTLPHGQSTIPLLVNHDDSREIGTVTELLRIEDTDGPWLAAIATVTDPPEWLKRDTPVSFGYSPLHTSPDTFGCEILRRGMVTEVSVLSPDRKPAEPLARVLTLTPSSPTIHGGGLIRRVFETEITIR